MFTQKKKTHTHLDHTVHAFRYMNIPFSTLYTLCKLLDMSPFPYIYINVGLATFDQGLWQTQIASERLCEVLQSSQTRR